MRDKGASLSTHDGVYVMIYTDDDANDGKQQTIRTKWAKKEEVCFLVLQFCQLGLKSKSLAQELNTESVSHYLVHGLTVEWASPVGQSDLILAISFM